MKKLFFTLCAAVISMAASAQDNLVVTLSHEDNISSYYGVDAMKEAYEDAVDGDVITLSAGEFNNPTTIEKALIIRGTGMKTSDEIADVTALKNSIIWNLPEELQVTPLIEGVYISGLTFYGKNSSAVAYVKKCTYNLLAFYGGTYYCKDCLSYWNNYPRIEANTNTVNNSPIYSNVVIQNSVLRDLKVSQYNHALVENCILNHSSNSGLANTTLRNSIITYANYVFDASCDVSYCIDGTGSDPLRNLGTNSSNNWVLEGSYAPYQSLFEQYNGKYNWHLTEEAAATYNGNDGTQVGIYGGANPFDPTITAPKVRKIVLNQQVSNGKLGVTIEVE